MTIWRSSSGCFEFKCRWQRSIWLVSSPSKFLKSEKSQIHLIQATSLLMRAQLHSPEVSEETRHSQNSFLKVSTFSNTTQHNNNSTSQKMGKYFGQGMRSVMMVSMHWRTFSRVIPHSKYLIWKVCSNFEINSTQHLTRFSQHDGFMQYRQPDQRFRSHRFSWFTPHEHNDQVSWLGRKETTSTSESHHQGHHLHKRTKNVQST